MSMGCAGAGHDIAKVTEFAASSFFNQVFRDGYFHADMHPGNIFIRDDGVLVPIDFGIMGYLEFADRLFLAQLLSAMLDRNYDEVALLHKNAGMLKNTVSVHQFFTSHSRCCPSGDGKGTWRSVIGYRVGANFANFNAI